MLIQTIDPQYKEKHVVIKADDVQQVIINQDNTGEVLVNALSDEGELHTKHINVSATEATRIIKTLQHRDFVNKERLASDT